MKAEQPLWLGATYNVIFASCSLRLVLTRSGAGSASGSKRPAAALASRKRALERKRRLWLGLLGGLAVTPTWEGVKGLLGSADHESLAGLFAGRCPCWHGGAW